MNFGKLILCFVSTLALAHSGMAQAAQPGHKSASSHGILSFLGPRTGTFKPLATPSGADSNAAVPIYTGEFTFKSTVATSTRIICEADADVFDTSGISHEESASVVATRSGSTATCTVTIPYSWALSGATDDTVSLTVAFPRRATAPQAR